MIAANQAFFFNDLGTRQVQADFSGGTLSSDGGVLLLRQADDGLGVTQHRVNVADHKFRDMRNVVEDEIPVRADQTRNIYVPVINA